MADNLNSLPSLVTVDQGLHFAHSLERNTQTMIEALPTYTDDQLYEILNAGASMELNGWRLQAAASAVLLDRALKVPVRQLGDQDGTGRMALARGLADRVGQSVSTIIEAAGLHNTFFSPEAQELIGDVSHLHQKTYYLIALRSKDPIDALIRIAQEKQNNPSFNTSDARKLVATQFAPSVLDTLPPYPNDRETKAALANLEQALHRLVAVLGSRARPIANSQLEEWQWELLQPERKYLEEIVRLITEEGIDEVDQIAPRLNVDRRVLQAWLTKLQSDGIMTSHEKPRPPKARGAARVGWAVTPEYYEQSEE